MRTVFLGSPPAAVQALEALIASKYSPIAVVTRPDRPQGRGRKLAKNGIVELAEQRAIPCFQPERADEPQFFEELRNLHPDIALVVSFGQILKKEFLELPRLGSFNLHFSLLPHHRGASPVSAAIFSGDLETGVTLQKMVVKLDAGGIVAQEKTKIGDRETAGELGERLSKIGAKLLMETLPLIESGGWKETPQEESQASYAKKISSADAWIDWNRTAQEIDRHVRGMNPWPGAKTMLETSKGDLSMKVLGGKILERKNAESLPGRVLESNSSGIVISCQASGAYRIEQLQPEAKRPMKAEEFLRGHAISPGARLKI